MAIANPLETHARAAAQPRGALGFSILNRNLLRIKAV
jgi:hypothetical protein